jgi:predicted Fe-Mo cluster-binding NifX family protein
MFRWGYLVVAGGLLLYSAAVLSGDDPTSTKEPLYAIAAEGKESTAEISKLSGVSPFYHLYKENGDAVEVVANPYLDLETGTGPAAAKMLIDKGMIVLIGRQVPGPKMMDVLDANKVRFVRRVGTVADVASELKE